MCENSGKNYIIIYGCQTGAGIKAASKLVVDTIELYMKNFDPEKGEIILPDMYSNVVISDAQLEVVTCVEAKKLVLER